MRYDLRKPCKNCPFANTPDRITFQCRERANEIEESAYRYGFPCHLSAELREDDDGGDDGYVPGPNTQHCVGAIAMFLNGGYETTPGQDNRTIRTDYREAQRIAFASPDAFLDANSTEEERQEAA